MPDTLDYDCPHQNADMTLCGALAGSPCRWQGVEPSELYHAERIDLAMMAHAHSGGEVSKEAFDADVLTLVD